MNIVARAQAFVESLLRIKQRREVDQRQCRVCGSRQVYKQGAYTRRPWTLAGRQTVVVQRYQCQSCGATHSDESADLLAGGWYARSVRRYTIDQWLHGGGSLRRVTERVRSLVGRQERWHIWYVVSSPDPEQPRCRLSHSTLHDWLDQAGRRAEEQLTGLYTGVSASGRLGHGRNAGCEHRLRRTGLLFSIYRNFTPAQHRQERARHYRHPGKSALEVAGIATEGYSYLDALQV